MKITAILPDDLVRAVNEMAQGKTTTASLSKALGDWVRWQKYKVWRSKLGNRPLKFADWYSAEAVRELNRRQRG